MSDKIKIESSITAKESPELRSVKHKAIAGVSEAELIERHTIGEFNAEKNDEEESEQQGT